VDDFPRFGVAHDLFIEIVLAVEHLFLFRLPARQPKAAVFLPTPEQVVQILKQLPEPSYSLMLLLVGTGLRVGEAIGLRWEDIDPNRKTLTVRRDIWHGKVNSPKYAASERVIPLGPILVDHLQNKLGRGNPWVFAGNSGKPMDPKNLAVRHLHPVLDRLEIRAFPGTGCASCIRLIWET
jgi:integrase